MEKNLKNYDFIQTLPLFNYYKQTKNFTSKAIKLFYPNKNFINKGNLIEII